MSPMSAELERVAFHEAGHAVAAFLLDRRPGTVTIEATKAYGGRCVTSDRALTKAQASRLWPIPTQSAALRRSVECGVVILLAGKEAERMFAEPMTGYVQPSECRIEAERIVPLAVPTPLELSRLRDGADVPFSPENSDHAKAWRAVNGAATSTLKPTAQSTQVAGAYLYFLEAVTSELVSGRNFQRLIERLVPPLLKHKTLAARSVRALLKGEPPDGSTT